MAIYFHSTFTQLLFSDPSSSAGLAVAVICGVQIVSLGSLFCFRSSTYRRHVEHQIDRAVAVALNARSQVGPPFPPPHALSQERI